MTRLIYYTSSLQHCGVASYQGHVAAGFDGDATCRTIRLSAERTPGGDTQGLRALRREMVALAHESQDADGILVDYADTFFNGARPGENLLDLFLGRLPRAPVVVVHEWPGRSDPPDAAGPWVARGLARARHLLRATLDSRRPLYESNLRRRFLRRAKAAVVHAPSLADPARIGLPATRVHLRLTPAYDPAAPAMTRAEVDARFRLAGACVVALLGTPQPSKGFDRAVRALAHLPKNVTMLQVGAVPRGAAAAAELARLAESLGCGDRYRATGPLTDGELAAVLLLRADAGCAPFRHVHHSSSLGHLIGAGVPVVAHDTPNVRAVADAGAGLALADCDEPAKLAAALIDALGAGGAGLRARQAAYAEAHHFRALAAFLARLAVGP